MKRATKVATKSGGALANVNNNNSRWVTDHTRWSIVCPIFNKVNCETIFSIRIKNGKFKKVTIKKIWKCIKAIEVIFFNH